MSFPHFDLFISLWKMTEQMLKVSCCFLSFWSFITKSILSLSIEKHYLDKVSFENMLSTYMFSAEAALPQVFDITER